MILKAAISALLFVWSAMALADSVNVLWRAVFTDRQGQVVGRTNSVSSAYIAKMGRCGHSINLRARIDSVPFAVLNCPGILDFSESAQLRLELVRGILAFKILDVQSDRGKALLAELDQIHFAHSPYGIFFSPQTASRFRYVAMNLSQLRLVIINPYFLKQIDDRELRTRFLLHEAIEALGYEDKDYGFSSGLGSTDPKTIAGGATVVGRGGDSDQLAFKLSILRALKKPFDFKIEGMPSRHLPTRKQLLKVTAESEVIVTSRDFFKDHLGLCTNGVSGQIQTEVCGGFLLKGPSGKPIIQINEDWGSLDSKGASRLLKKVITMMVFQVARENQSAAL